MSVKRDPARQIMLSPKKHVPNYVLMKDVNTWNTIETVFTTLSKKINACALEGIAVNFGKWETASAKDESEYALDCHGHFHMHLSRIAVNTLSHIDSWKAIHGRVKHPENYLDKDIHELEVRRLIPLENSVIWGELGLVQKDLTDLRATVSTSSTTVASLQGTVASLQETVATFHETVATFHETVATFQETVATFQETVVTFQETVATFQETVATFQETVATRARDDIQKIIDMIKSKNIRDCILMGA